MNHPIQAKQLQSVKPSPSAAAVALVEKYREQGRAIISLTVGEPDFNTPEPIIEAAFNAAKNGQTHYTGVNGTKALQQAIVNKFSHENNLQVGLENIAVGSGAKQLIYTAFAASINSGDEVIIPTPYWVSYPDMVLLQGGKPVLVETNNAENFKITPEKLEKAITKKSKWLVLNSPNNPTGAVYSEAELHALFAILKKHPHIWIMADEIYEHFIYDAKKFISMAAIDKEIASRCLIVNGVSKAYAMTGWRIGYCCGPTDIIKPIKTILSQSTTCPNAISQAATIEALTSNQQFVYDLAKTFEKRRNLIVKQLNKINGIHCPKPEGAFYVFPDISSFYQKTTVTGQVIQSDFDFATYLIEEAGVATIAGTSFGMAGHIRCSFATSSKTLERAVLAVKIACDKLK